MITRERTTISARTTSVARRRASAAASGHIIGIDTGGTFTDVVVLRSDGELVFGKSPTTPHDLAVGVMDAVGVVAEMMGLDAAGLLARSALFKHGTTLATNALINRQGARVGFITTHGFEDTTLIMRGIGRVDGLPEEEVRHIPFITKPEPLVPRERIRGVRERIDERGGVVIPLSLADVDGALRALVEEERCEAIAVSLLHAWADPAHEERIKARARELGYAERVFWSFGSDLARQAGEYARANTAIVNAFIGPVVQRYLGDLEARLRAAGFRGTFLVMQGNGGAAGRLQCSPISSLQSGPAAGLRAATYLAQLLGHRKVLTADMGGTSFDVSSVSGGFWRYADEPIFTRLRILQPIVEIESIGAGGGTISRADPVTRRLLVGPQSAGAQPGPVCYDQGGTEVTTTDVNLALGYIDPAYFLGGRKALHRAKADAAIRALAATLDLRPLEVAAGVYQIINSKMADLVRTRISKSGELPEDFILYAFGGASPLHAAAIADELGIRSVYVFPTSPVLSAFGAATSDVIYSRVMTYQATMPAAVEAFNGRLAEIERELLALMEGDGFGRRTVVLRRFVSMRFRRQTYGVELELPWDRLSGTRVAQLLALFERTYREAYGPGVVFAHAGVEINRLRVDAVADVGEPALKASRIAARRAARPKGTREAYVDGRMRRTPLYEWGALRPGMRLAGPAIVESELTNVIVPRGWRAAVDGYRNVVLSRAGAVT